MLAQEGGDALGDDTSLRPEPELVARAWNEIEGAASAQPPGCRDRRRRMGGLVGQPLDDEGRRRDRACGPSSLSAHRSQLVRPTQRNAVGPRPIDWRWRCVQGRPGQRRGRRRPSMLGLSHAASALRDETAGPHRQAGKTGQRLEDPRAAAKPYRRREQDERSQLGTVARESQRRQGTHREAHQRYRLPGEEQIAAEAKEVGGADATKVLGSAAVPRPEGQLRPPAIPRERARERPQLRRASRQAVQNERARAVVRPNHERPVGLHGTAMVAAVERR